MTGTRLTIVSAKPPASHAWPSGWVLPRPSVARTAPFRGSLTRRS